MTTNGRGLYHSAIYVWRWSDAGAMRQHAPPSLDGWDFVAVVPGQDSRPEFIPEHAERRPIGGEDTFYCWKTNPGRS